jgi:hypothetical protein
MTIPKPGLDFCHPAVFSVFARGGSITVCVAGSFRQDAARSRTANDVKTVFIGFGLKGQDNLQIAICKAVIPAGTVMQAWAFEKV